MAQIVYVEVDNNNLIVGVHKEDIPPSRLPQGFSTIKKTVEDPISLLGLDVARIDDAPNARKQLFQLTESETFRNQLKQLSIELDLMQRLGEDRTTKQAEFDALRLQYEAL